MCVWCEKERHVFLRLHQYQSDLIFFLYVCERKNGEGEAEMDYGGGNHAHMCL